MKPSESQVGGDHYKSMAIEASEFIQKNGIGWCAGNAIKYVCRYHRKNGEQDIDKAIRLALNHPQGPLQLGDINLSVNLAGLEYMHKELGDEYRPCPEMKRRVNAGLLGRKTGRGFYHYEE